MIDEHLGYFVPDNIVPGPGITIVKALGVLMYHFGGGHLEPVDSSVDLVTSPADESTFHGLRPIPSNLHPKPEDYLYVAGHDELIFGSLSTIRRSLKHRLANWTRSPTEALMIATCLGDYRLLMFWNDMATNPLSLREVDQCVQFRRPPPGLRAERSSLPMVEYYERLFACLEAARHTIVAISTMSELEWTDSAIERRFFDLMVEAAKRGVIVRRVFVMPKDLQRKAVASLHAVRAHCWDYGPQMLKGYVITPEELRLRDPRLENTIGDGFISFDDEIVLVDAFDGQQARGKITRNASDISRLLAIHQRLQNAAKQLTLGVADTND